MAAEQPRTRRMTVEAHGYISWSIMPLETFISLPVPVGRTGRLEAACFGALTVPLADRSNDLVYRPSTWIYVDWEVRVVGHVMTPDGFPTEEDRPVGLLFPSEFAGALTDEREQRIHEAHWGLYRLLDEVGPLYEGSDLSPKAHALVARCDRAYRRVVPSDIWPLYDALNPDFFRWLRSATGGSG